MHDYHFVGCQLMHSIWEEVQTNVKTFEVPLLTSQNEFPSFLEKGL